jgi:hypothetical protein
MRDRGRLRHELFAVFLIFVIQFVIYREYWIGTKIFTGKDLLTAFSLLLNFQSDCLQEGSLPLWNPYMNFGYPFVEHYSNSMFFPTHLLMGFVTGSSLLIIQREILFWIFMGGLGTYLSVREQGLSPTTGVIAATGYMFCGQLMALPQWHVLVYNAACFPWLVYGYYRSMRTNQPLSLISIAFLAFTIFGGHITTTVLGIYIFAAFVMVDAAMNKRLKFAGTYLVVTLLFTFAITSPKLFPMLESLKLNPRMNNPENNKDASNIINSYSFLSYLIPVKYYFSIQVGQIAVVAFCYALIRRSAKFTSLLLLFFLTAWLLIVDNQGNTSLLRQAVNVFPLMRLVRNEWFEWFYPSLFLIIYLARYIEDFLCEKRIKVAGGAILLCIAITSVAFFTAYDTGLHWKAFLTHCALAAATATLVLIPAQKSIRLICAAIFVCCECLFVFNRVNVDTKPLILDNSRIINVTHQVNASRSYRDNQLAAKKAPILALDDAKRPTISDSMRNTLLFSGLDGNFMDSMNYKRFAGWWYNAQERYDFIKLKESPQLAAMEGLPLYELLAQSNFMPSGNVSFDSISCRSFEFSTDSSSPSLFLLHQFDDSRWKATVDGRAHPIERVEGYFMGISLWEGSHKIVFRFSDRYFTSGLFVSGGTICLLTLLSLRCRSKRKVKGFSPARET